MRGRRSGAVLAAVATLLMVVAGPGAPATTAATTWQISRSPTSAPLGVTTAFHLTFSNLGGPSGSDDLGCVRITIPLTFDVSSVAVTHQPSGGSWVASTSSRGLVLQE